MSVKSARERIQDLLQELEHHEQHEGNAVQFCNRNGSWEDVADRVGEIDKILCPHKNIHHEPADPGTGNPQGGSFCEDCGATPVSTHTPNTFTEAGAQELGFLSQADMRAEDWD